VKSLFKKVSVTLGLLLLAGVLIWSLLAPLRNQLARTILDQAQSAFNQGDWGRCYSLSWRSLFLGHWGEDNILLLSRSAHEEGKKRLEQWFYGQLFQLTDKPLLRAEAAVGAGKWHEAPTLLRQATADESMAALPWFYLTFLESEPRYVLKANLRQGYMKGKLLAVYKTKELLSASGYRKELMLMRLAWRLNEKKLAFYLAQRLIERDPFFSPAWAELGRFYFLDGQNSFAKKAVDTALKLDPLDELALKVRDSL